MYFSVFQLSPQILEAFYDPANGPWASKDTKIHQPTKQRQHLTCLTAREPIHHPEFQVFTVRLQRSSSGTLGLQLRGLDVVTWSDF